MSETEDSEDILITDKETSWDWSKGNTMALITELKKYPCLYSKLDKDYSNLTQKNEKLNLMVEKLKQIKPDVTLTCIQREIATLQRQMLAETTKKKKLGNLYQPKLWCYDKLFFLADSKLKSVPKKLIHTTKSQLQIMVDFMIQHKDLSEENRGARSDDAKVVSNQLWQTLTDKLNANGIQNRSLGQWRKVWSLYKCRVRKKVRKYKKDKITTGGVSNRTTYFTALEQGVIDLFNLKVDLNEDADSKLTSVSEKFTHTTKSQFQIMVDFMIQHKDLDEENWRARSGYVKEIADQLWQTLTDKLNADGIPNRSLGQWKKVWLNYKAHLKIKVHQYKKDKTTTGGGPSKTEYFTAQEQAVIDLLNWKVDLTEDADAAAPKKFTHTSKSQFQIMVDFMMQHKDLDGENWRARSGYFKETADQLWQTLTDKLNADGIPNRSLGQWKKVWLNYKAHLKIKVHQYKKDKTTTGGGPSKTEYFTAQEQAVIDLLNWKVDLTEDFKHTKKSQLQIMVDFMIQHKDLGAEDRRSQNGYVKELSKQLWQTLTDKLNADCIPKRSLCKWKKMWLNYKYGLIKKVRQYKKDKVTTGGGPSKTEYFTFLEQDIIDLLNLKVDLNEDVMPDSDKELFDKYILLETILHEWTQCCQKYNFSLTDYAVRRKALVLANIIEMKDFDASPEWISNFKEKFKIECPIETTEVIVSALTALGTVNIYDVAHDLRIQNKFPERVSKIYDEKFKHKDSIGEDQPVKKKRKLEPKLTDLTETCEEDVEILPTNSDSKIISNIEFQTSKSQDLINDINVTTCPLTEANPSAPSLIQLNKKSAIRKIRSVSTISQNSESSVNNNINLEEDVVSIQSQEDVASIESLYDKEFIISEKKSLQSSNNARVLCAEEDIEDLLTNYTITLENIPKSSISSENERVPVMDTSENCGDTQLDTNCEDTSLINCENKVLAADIHDDKLNKNKSEKLIENKIQNVSKKEKLPPIQNYKDALIQLKILEDFALIKCNFRAINFITNLEHVYKNKLKNKCRFS